MTTAIRLHMFAIPHTITCDEFSHCAFTGKVLRFAPMMRSRGYEVYHYGIETSISGATKQIDLMTVSEWMELRIKSFMMLHPEKTKEESKKCLTDPTAFIGELGNMSTSLYTEFNRRLKIVLQEHYRSNKTDIVCLPYGKSHNAAIAGLNIVPVETGIGYENSSHNYRIFESNAWLHHELAKENKWGQNYWFVVPNYFDVHSWPLTLCPKLDTVGFLGRIYNGKGCNEIAEIAGRMPHIRFILCGQGDATPFLRHPNMFYRPSIHGMERSVYLGSLVACLAPTSFIEPFCGVAVEAQLCGTPVMTKDYGAQTETVEQGITGLRCHTLEDYCVGIRLAVAGKFDRQYIRDRARKLYDMYNVAKQYDYVFRTILDVHNGANGWYSHVSHLDKLEIGLDTSMSSPSLTNASTST